MGTAKQNPRGNFQFYFRDVMGPGCSEGRGCEKRSVGKGVATAEVRTDFMARY